MKMRVFITGGTGFFGKSMLDYRLRHPEWRWAQSEWTILSRDPVRFMEENPVLASQQGVSFVAGDVRDFKFPDGKYDSVIHAATDAVTTLADDEMTAVVVNGTRHVLEFARRCDANKFMLTSSGAVYGQQSQPVDEEAACSPRTAYGRGKLLAEQLCIESGLNVLLPRCFAFVGPYLNRRIHFAIGNFIQNCLNGKPIVIRGDGLPLRSYLYADDLVEWLFAILERGECARPYNVGSGTAMTIREVAEGVRKALKSTSEIRVRGMSCAGASSVYVPNIARVRSELGLQEKIGFIDAIRKSAGQ